MADPQDQPIPEPEGESTPPAKKPPAKKQPPAKAATPPAKKAPAKKAPAKKAPAKKAAAKKAPAKAENPAPAPPKPAEPPKPPESPADLQQRIETNGDLTAAAKDVAAQAKSTIEDAKPVRSEPALPASGSSPLPLLVALAVSLLAILLIRQLRRR
jgi:hypothetical protein